MAKIVVAEDDKLISNSLCDALKTAGYEPTPAYDGEEAVAKAKEVMPDLLLLDIMMPKLDGISVLWELKANPATAKIPVVVLTNIGDVETISKIVEAGAVDYLLKSDQSVDDIIQKVRDVLGRTVKLA
ncbi:MAG TPA: response regulator [Patescibacteria group bacterium]|nr:response regulator [Patescibacteria group bacterium]